MTREKLPNRRGSYLLDFQHGGIGHTLAVGFYDEKTQGRIAEVFIDCHKRATGMADNARDAATTASIALQHGAPLLTIYEALNRYETGEAAGVLGSALDALKEVRPDLFLSRQPVIDTSVSRSDYDQLKERLEAVSQDLQQAKDTIVDMEIQATDNRDACQQMQDNLDAAKAEIREKDRRLLNFSATLDFNNPID